MTEVRGHNRGTWDDVVAACGGALPEYGSVDYAILPQPPLIKESTKPAKAATMLLQAYATMLQIVYSRRYSVPDPVIEHKDYAKLVDVAGVMYELKIAPIAWVAFSIEVWREYVAKPRARNWNDRPSALRGRVSKGTPPTLGWVMSEKRLRERTGWFSWCEQKFRGGQVHVTEAHREIIKRRLRMKRALIDAYAKGTLTPETARGIVGLHLSRAQFERLKEKAETEGEVRQSAWDRQAAKGDWLW